MFEAQVGPPGSNDGPADMGKRTISLSLDGTFTDEYEWRYDRHSEGFHHYAGTYELRESDKGGWNVHVLDITKSNIAEGEPPFATTEQAAWLPDTCDKLTSPALDKNPYWNDNCRQTK